jgi:hypothetical protein
MPTSFSISASLSVHLFFPTLNIDIPTTFPLLSSRKDARLLSLPRHIEHSHSTSRIDTLYDYRAEPPRHLPRGVPIFAAGVPATASKSPARAVVYELLTVEDAFNYIGSGRPDVMFASDPAIIDEKNRRMLFIQYIG